MPMIDDWLLSLIYAAWLAASTMPLGFMLGSSCSPCCGQQGCEVADGKPRTDPVNEGTWTPSGTWRGAGGVTWTFTANPGDDSGETWFFYGSSSTSSPGGFATTAQARDWYNICNWYSNKTTSPSTTSGLPGALDKRATRLPPNDAVVHIYSTVVTTSAGPVTVKNAYFWLGSFTSSSEMTTTGAAHDSVGGCVFNGATENNSGSAVSGGATFNDSSYNTGSSSTVNGGATFNDTSANISDATINDGAVFNDSSYNTGSSSTVNGGAQFFDSAVNSLNGVINDGAVFNDTSTNSFGGIINGGATFNDSSINGYEVNGGAIFNDNSRNGVGLVSGGATFNDAACSSYSTGNTVFCPGGANRRRFAANITDLPTCNGTAPNGCDLAATCGCG